MRVRPLFSGRPENFGRVSPAAQKAPTDVQDLENLAYVIGLAIGDGNLSNPNGRATKLRISCDVKYPQLIERIVGALEKVLPNNKVNTIIRPRNCVDVYVCSNRLENWLGWRAGHGPKHVQDVRVPEWIKSNPQYIVPCLRGLFETDGSIYLDRGYLMTIFVTVIKNLAADVFQMISIIGFTAHVYEIHQKPPQLTRYNLRISKNTKRFIDTIDLQKN